MVKNGRKRLLRETEEERNTGKGTNWKKDGNEDEQRVKRGE